MPAALESSSPYTMLLLSISRMSLASPPSLGVAILIMVIFSLFVQAAEGSTYGIVPYVDPPSIGSIAGIAIEDDVSVGERAGDMGA